jgi:hypothetical protein
VVRRGRKLGSLQPVFGCGVCGSELGAWQGENRKLQQCTQGALIWAFTFFAKMKTYKDGEQVGGGMGKERPARRAITSPGLSSALSV